MTPAFWNVLAIAIFYELFIKILIDRETVKRSLMTMFPTWALERFAYWTVFALMVLSIEKLGGNLN
jgi:hypothetical protein